MPMKASCRQTQTKKNNNNNNNGYTDPILKGKFMSNGKHTQNFKLPNILKWNQEINH